MSKYILGYVYFLGQSETTRLGIKYYFHKKMFLSQFDPLPIPLKKTLFWALEKTEFQ